MRLEDYFEFLTPNNIRVRGTQILKLESSKLYQDEFLKGLDEALTDVETGQFEKIHTFEAFIS
jgi:hypothetical protein